MNTYKLLLVDPSNINIRTLLQAVKGFPIGVVLAHNLPGGELLKVIDTHIKVKRKKK